MCDEALRIIGSSFEPLSFCTNDLPKLLLPQLIPLRVIEVAVCLLDALSCCPVEPQPDCLKS